MPSPPGCIEYSPENGKPATTRRAFASVAGRTTGSASSLIGCHVLQWDGLLGLYPYWPFLCHKDNYSNAAITVHALDGGEFLAYSLECVEGEFLTNFALTEFSEVGGPLL